MRDLDSPLTHTAAQAAVGRELGAHRQRQPDRRLGARLLGDEDLRERQVEGARDLHGSFVARDRVHSPANRLDEAGVVRGRPGLVHAQGGTLLVCANEDVPAEALRGLHGHHVRAARRADDHAGGVHRLEGVGDGQDGDDRARAAGNRVDDAPGDLRGRQGPRRVVHEDDRVRLAAPERGQAEGHGLLTRAIGAGDDGEVVDIGQGATKFLDRRGRGRHDDRTHSPGA